MGAHSRGSTLARRFRDRVQAAADGIDRDRRLPDDLAAALAEAGIFRALLPARLDGLELTLSEFLDLALQLAEADASTAWCVVQGAVIGTTTVWLDAGTAAELWADPLAATANGPPRNCVAEPDGAGYRLTGTWGFSSGCQHANWMIGAARLSGSNTWLMTFFPKAAVQLHDNWQVQGLRGTGSFEFSVRDLVIEERFAADMRNPPNDPGTLYRIPTGLVFAVSFAAVALGVARAGLDVVLALAGDKVPGYSREVLKDDANVQATLGRAEARWRAARSYLYGTVADTWKSLEGGAPIDESRRIALRMAGTHVIREAAAVLDAAWGVAGSSGIYADNPLHRRFQDMHVITQHVQGRHNHYAYVGRWLLGFPFEPGPLN